MDVTSDDRSTQLLVRSLLDRHRDGFVMAIGDDGLAVDLPLALERVGTRVAPGRSMLDIVDRAHRRRVIEAWEQVRAAGGSQTQVRLAGAVEDTVVHFLDARSLHGVYLAFLNPLDGGDLPRAPTAAERAAEAPPRVAVVRKDEVAVFVAVDQATTGMLGWTAAELVKTRSLDLVHPDDHNLAIESWLDLLERPETQERVRLRYRTRDRGYRWLEITNHNRLHDLDHGDVRAEMIDVTDEVAAVDALRASEQLLRRLADTVPVGLVQVDRDGRVAYANDRFAELVRRPLAEQLADQLAGARPADRTAVLAALDAVLADGGDRDVEARFSADDGPDVVHATLAIRALTDDAGDATGAIICVSDVTEAARTHDDLAQRALRDPLTGGHNRPGLLAALDDLLADGTRRTAVLFVDLDGFKAVNDEHGHQTGDEVLRATARRLRGAMRATDIVGRLGGDEFIVICPDVQPAEAAGLAGRADRVLGAPLVVDGVAIPVEASIGVALAPDGGGPLRSSANLIAAADAAMYQAKHDRRDGGPGRPVTAEPGG